MIGESFRLQAKPNSKTPVRKGVWKCCGCRKQFTVTVGTIFEGSHIPLNKWLLPIHLLCASKKDMSSLQFQRMLGVSYKTAWFLSHRIREMLSNEPTSKLSGTVEVDETYVGGKKKGKRGVPGPESKKTPVLGMVERGGNVRSFTLDRVTLKNIKPMLGVCRNETVFNQESITYRLCTVRNLLILRSRNSISDRLLEVHIGSDAMLNTDDAAICYMAKPTLPNHASVNHSKEKYVRRGQCCRR